MHSLSQRVAGATESQTLAISARARKMTLAGVDVVSLATGEPDFATPECAKHAAIRAIEENFTHYTESSGIAELRKAVAQKFRQENSITCADESTVLISCGAKHSIMNTLAAICNAGDEVIIPAPFWVSYPAMVTLAGANPVIVPASATNSYKLQPQELADSLRPNTKCVIFNSPSNPTGMMYSRSEFEALAEVLSTHDCYIISDEIYEKINYGSVEHFSPGAIDSIAGRVITVNGCSKAYAMTGWRIGFMNAPSDVFAQAAKVQSQDTSNPSSIAQKAALAALEQGAGEVESMRREFARRREMVCGAVDAIGGVRFFAPDGAFYLWLDIHSLLSDQVPSSADFCERLLEDHHCALVPGEAFGYPGYLRLSFAACDEDIIKGVQRLSEMVRSCYV